MSYPILQLKPGKERSVNNRHPWVFSGAVAKMPKAAEGEIIAIHDAGNKPLALGHLSLGGSIVSKLFAFGAQLPKVDDAFWMQKFQQALEVRLTLGCGQGKATDGYRLFFAEGDELPGLVCDVFGDCAVLQIRSKGMRAIESLIVKFLRDVMHMNHIAIKGDNKGEIEWLLGEQKNTAFLECGLKFATDVQDAQKTGYFFDQRDNRQLVATYAKGRIGLDAFCYSGGFSVHALAGGAAHITSLDISKDAMIACDQNVTLNGFSDRHDALVADCFDYLNDMPANHFDLIVLDPPAFTKSAATVQKAARGYKDINLKAMQKIKPGGVLFTYSCSQHIPQDLFRKIVFGAAADSGRNVRILHQLHQAPDHPVSIYHPEGDYLKGLALHVE